jgi:hypothetical protein
MTEEKEKKAEYDRFMEASKAAETQGEIGERLTNAVAAFETFPRKYPENYQALLVAQECLKSLQMEEEAKEIQKTMSQILMEHDTKKRVEAEAKGRHPLAPGKRKEM